MIIRIATLSVFIGFHLSHIRLPGTAFLLFKIRILLLLVSEETRAVTACMKPSQLATPYSYSLNHNL